MDVTKFGMGSDYREYNIPIKLIIGMLRIALPYLFCK